LLTKRLFDAFCDLKVTDRISVSKKRARKEKIEFAHSLNNEMVKKTGGTLSPKTLFK